MSTSVKFLHFRYIDNGRVASRGGRTFAYQDQGDGTFRVAVSKCHLNDNFNKKLARARAAGRLNSVSESFTLAGPYENVLNYATTDAGNYGMVRKFASKPYNVEVNEGGLTASQSGLVL